MIYNWYDLLYNLFTFTVVIPILLGLVRWSVLTRSERWVVIFLITLLAHELLSILCIALHTRNHFLYYIQTVLVLCSVAGVYSGIIGIPRFLWCVAVTVGVLMVLEVEFRVGFNHINSATLAISRLLPALYACICLYRLVSMTTSGLKMSRSIVYMHIGFAVIGAFTALNACFKSYFIETSLDLYYLSNNISAMMSALAFAFFSLGLMQIKSTQPTFSYQ